MELYINPDDYVVSPVTWVSVFCIIAVALGVHFHDLYEFTFRAGQYRSSYRCCEFMTSEIQVELLKPGFRKDPMEVYAQKLDKYIKNYVADSISLPQHLVRNAGLSFEDLDLLVDWSQV